MKYIKLQEEFNNIGRIVFTGVSGSGKTTTINEFKKLGYNIVKEISRDLISYLKINNPSLLP